LGWRLVINLFQVAHLFPRQYSITIGNNLFGLALSRHRPNSQQEPTPNLSSSAGRQSRWKTGKKQDGTYRWRPLWSPTHRAKDAPWMGQPEPRESRSSFYQSEQFCSVFRRRKCDSEALPAQLHSRSSKCSQPGAQPGWA
jgi:hypothetical protein